jgi:hypothetical protein
VSLVLRDRGNRPLSRLEVLVNFSSAATLAGVVRREAQLSRRMALVPSASGIVRGDLHRPAS